MGRAHRIQLANGLYHVTSRGNDRQRIFAAVGDVEQWIEIAGGVVLQRDWRCHAYTVMPNHFHLLVETPKPDLSDGMRDIKARFAKAFNRRHGRTGHVHGGRYYGVPIETDSHALECGRYIVLNAIRGGLCDVPDQWPWSSFAATAGLREPPPFLETDWLLSLFAKDRERAQEIYRQFVYDRLGDYRSAA